MSLVAKIEPLVIPTYPVGAPEKNPVFFEKRVYQGSSGKVYPVPFIDKVFDAPQDATYLSARLENEFVRLVMLPEIGGRIFLGQDKTNSDYDFFYRQNVIKPALVGLAGPWISGGVEFNWPQHHRPGTFMPADVFIEEEADGARTVWMSEHDPLNRLKGMHGIRLRPDSSLIELRGCLYNRTPLTQTFLWWANVAAMVHDQYQSFFPPDVHYVADHAVRAMSSFPLANNSYYGVDYQNRPGANDLGWYKNIPVPTSYMVCETKFNFFGGYDFKAGGGFVHVANRHVAPGKKQWTWGDHAFGHAWDRELTDTNGPYIELMAGVHTDNQPDFSYLTPYETKTFSQFWWPIQGIGPVQQATDRAALRLVVRDDRRIELGLCVSKTIRNATLRVMRGADILLEEKITLAPGEAWKNESLKFTGEDPATLSAILIGKDGQLLLGYRPVDEAKLTRTRELATEPPAPAEISSNDQLYLTGEHLELYRHPTRMPEPYWNEALRRDPGDVRSHIGLGRRSLKNGLFADAEAHFSKAIARLTHRHPNPETGEAHYFLGLSLAFQDRHDDAYPVLYKATWNHAWRSAAYYQLACIDCRRHDWPTALEHLNASLATNQDHAKAATLKGLVLHRLGRRGEAIHALPTESLDHWSAVAASSIKLAEIQIPESSRNDAQTILDLAFDFIEAGFQHEAIGLLDAHHAAPVTPVAVPNPLERSAMTCYLRAWLTCDSADLAAARASCADHFFPSRLDEMRVLGWALAQPGHDPLAAYGLGNLFFDKGRHAEAITAWERAAAEGTTIPQVHRNLGIAVWNLHRDGDRANACYTKARELDPSDARLVSETDQLAKKRNRPLAERLAFLEAHRDLVLQRDDATVELASLLNLTERPQDALDLLTSRRFHPWEGGEGAVLRQYTRARVLLGQLALANGDPGNAHRQFSLAMETPDSLGEAYHPLQAKADVNYWIARSLQKLGRVAESTAAFEACATESGDFTEMAVAEHSPLSWFRGLALRALGREDEALVLFHAMRDYASRRKTEPATIDYFATSLPDLLVFDEDLKTRRDAGADLIAALAHHGLGEPDTARAALDRVLAFDQSLPQALALSKNLQKSDVLLSA